jgi:hypothetical protein
VRSRGSCLAHEWINACYGLDVICLLRIHCWRLGLQCGDMRGGVETLRGQAYWEVLRSMDYLSQKGLK